MTETHSPAIAHDDSGSHVAYGKVWFALLIFTVLEYFYASWKKDQFVVLVLGLMLMATIKAALVAIYFMHLKFEGKWVYVWLIPAGFLVIVFISALYPDIGMQRTTWPDYSDEEGFAVPAFPDPAAHLPLIVQCSPTAPAAGRETCTASEA